MAKINLNDVLKGVGNTDEVETSGNLSISGNGFLKLSTAHIAAGVDEARAVPVSCCANLVDPVWTTGYCRLKSQVAAGVATFIKNASTTKTLTVYPPIGHTIIGSAAGGAFVLKSAVGAAFIGVSETSWLALRDVGTAAY